MIRQRLQEAGCLLLVFGTLGLVLMPNFNWPRPAARRVSCQSNLKQLSNALRLYAADYDEHLPPAGKWTSAIRPTNDRLFRCPSDSVGIRVPSYAVNSNTSGRSSDSAPAEAAVVLLFDSDLHRWNAAGTQESVAQPARHEESANGIGCGRRRVGNNYAFLDGHVKWLLTVPDFSYPPAGGAGARKASKALTPMDATASPTGANRRTRKVK